MGKKKKQKKKPINWQELAISAVIDLIIGTILIIIGKYIGQGESPNQQADIPAVTGECDAYVVSHAAGI